MTSQLTSKYQSTAHALSREQWLNKLARKLRPAFKEAGATLPARLRISCGWPSSRALASASSKSRTIGQCWPLELSADGTAEVFISPAIADTAQVAHVLTHELIHAADNCANGHKAKFRKIALRLGLTGKMTATTAGPELAERLNALCKPLGNYPHARLDLSKVKKQGTRMLKLECPECGYTVRTTQKWLDIGAPVCPCGTELAGDDDSQEEED